MGTFGSGPFQNDVAMDFAQTIIDPLVRAASTDWSRDRSLRKFQEARAAMVMLTQLAPAGAVSRREAARIQEQMNRGLEMLVYLSQKTEDLLASKKDIGGRAETQLLKRELDYYGDVWSQTRTEINRFVASVLSREKQRQPLI